MTPEIKELLKILEAQKEKRVSELEQARQAGGSLPPYIQGRIDELSLVIGDIYKNCYATNGKLTHLTQ